MDEQCAQNESKYRNKGYYNTNIGGKEGQNRDQISGASVTGGKNGRVGNRVNHYYKSTGVGRNGTKDSLNHKFIDASRDPVKKKSCTNTSKENFIQQDQTSEKDFKVNNLDNPEVVQQNVITLQKYLCYFKLQPQVVPIGRFDGKQNAILHLPLPEGDPVVIEGHGSRISKAKHMAIADAVSYVTNNNLMKSVARVENKSTLLAQASVVNSLVAELKNTKNINNKKQSGLTDSTSVNINKLDNTSDKKIKKFINAKPLQDSYLHNTEGGPPDWSKSIPEMRSTSQSSNYKNQTSTSWLSKASSFNNLQAKPYFSSLDNKLGRVQDVHLSASSLCPKNAGWNNYAQSSSTQIPLNSDKSSNSWFSMNPNALQSRDILGSRLGFDLSQSNQSSSDNRSYLKNSSFFNGSSVGIYNNDSNTSISDKSRWAMPGDPRGANQVNRGRMEDIISTNPHTRKVKIPPNFDSKKFLDYYFTRAGLSQPKAVLIENRASKYYNKHENQSWTAIYDVPMHKVNGKDLKISINVTENTKKRAVETARLELLIHLLQATGEDYVKDFHNSTMSFKKRVEKMISEPLNICFPASSVLRLTNLLSILKSKDAFNIPSKQNSDDDYDYPIKNSNKIKFLHPHVQSPIKLSISSIKNVYKNSTALPVHNMYVEITHAVETNPVVIISAQTGAGKTTQVPQFILDYYLTQGSKKQDGVECSKPPAVICTQPRRIAAISIANLVESERVERRKVSNTVGYSVRFASKKPISDHPAGTILFCTSGILLNRFQTDPMLESYTHIILDEVHERDLNTDLLLILIRHLLTKRNDLRLILMSATADTDIFMEYFRGYGTTGPHKMPALIEIPGRMYPVKEYYLEDVVDILHRDHSVMRRFHPSSDQNDYINSEIAGAPCRFREEPIPYDYLEALITHICTSCGEGTILIFLPGWQEIRCLHNILMEDRYGVGYANSKLFELHSLHSSIPIESQTLVFRRPPPGCRKIIISTGIAETSITIDDVVYVVDLGKVRVNSYSPDCRISMLKCQWASLSNIRQRMGRAGRTKPGIYYSFLSTQRKGTLPYNIPSEMLRVDLQQVALLIKSLKLARHVKDVFALAPSPPSMSSIDKVLEQLVILGALDNNERMTPLGNLTCRLAIDPWIAKMTILGTIFSCMDSVVTVSALMETSKNLYHITLENKEEAWKHIISTFAKNSQSDQSTALNAFRSWLKKIDVPGSRSNCYHQRLKMQHQAQNESHDYAVGNYLNFSTCLNVRKHRSHLLKIINSTGLLKLPDNKNSRLKYLKHDHFLDMDDATFQLYNENDQNLTLVRAILAGALYPNISEIKSRDEYRTFTDRFSLRLTATCVNSWKSLLMMKEAELKASGRGKEFYSVNDVRDTNSSEQDKKSGRNLRQAKSLASLSQIRASKPSESSASCEISPIYYVDPPEPVRLVVFEQKQQVDNAYHLRQVTKCSPIALILFANFETIECLTDEKTNKSMFLIDKLISITTGDSADCYILIELRKWLDKYLEWVIWDRCSRELDQGIDKEEELAYFGSESSFDSEQSEGEAISQSRDQYLGKTKPSKADPELEKLGKLLINEVVSILDATEETS